MHSYHDDMSELNELALYAASRWRHFAACSDLDGRPSSISKKMSAMNWGAFDLNMLIVFDAVMQDRSVTRAGNRFGLSLSVP
jgi:hypothetical protein